MFCKIFDFEENCLLYQWRYNQGFNISDLILENPKNLALA
jgi:hypothetical protein